MITAAGFGFWIENGKITWPATEATIAGNLKDIFNDMMPADDLELTQSIAAPSVFVKQMMVAGSWSHDIFISSLNIHACAWPAGYA